MRKTVLVIILLFCCVLFSGCITSEPEAYVVAVDPALQPLSMKSPGTGEPVGFDVEMLEWIAQDQGINFTYKFMTLEAVVAGAGSGSYDLKPSMINTPERQEILDFSDSYLDSAYTIIAKKKSGITMEDVLTDDDLVIATVAGSTAPTARLQEYLGQERYDQMLASGNIVRKDTKDEAVYAVSSGEADLIICPDLGAVTLTRDMTYLQIVGNLKGNAAATIAVPKGNPTLLAKLNAGLANFKASPKYNQLRDKYRIPYLKDTYVVGIDPNNIPFTYYDENGNLTGFDYESILWIANNSGFKVTFTEGNWATNINALIKGDINMWYSGMTITSERSEFISFSDPYLTGGLAVLTLGNKTITPSEFESGSVVIGSMINTTDDKWVKEFFGDRYASMFTSGKYLLVPDLGNLFEALEKGKVDCILVDEIGYRMIMQEKGFQLVTTYPYPQDNGVAVRNGDVALLNAINKGIASMRGAGVYDQLKEKYLL